MPTVNSNVKLITSNQAPTTSNLAKGEMAFGQVAGINSIYGNTGNGIIKIEFTASGEPIIYFANEEALNTFVEGDDVPTSGWYAAIADSIYEQYREWVAYKITFEDIDGTTTGVYKPTFTQIGASSNGNAFYNLVPNESGIFTNTSVVSSMFNQTIDTINMGNYAHTRYFLYSTNGYINDLFRTYLCYKQKGGNQYRVELNSDDFILEDVGVGYKASIDYNMDNYTGNPGTDSEDNQYFTIWQSRSSDSSPFDPLYLVIKEIISDGEPWINWNEIIALDSGDEPAPTTTYAQVSLSAMLSNGINSVKLSDYKETGTLASPQEIVLADDYTLRMDGIANRNTKFTIDASIPFFGYPDYSFPSLQVKIYPSGYGQPGVVESDTEEVVEPRVQFGHNIWIVNPVYEQGSKIVRWQGQIEKNLSELLGATTRDSYGKPLDLYIEVMQYQEGDTPTLSGTLKIEDA